MGCPQPATNVRIPLVIGRTETSKTDAQAIQLLMLSIVLTTRSQIQLWMPTHRAISAMTLEQRETQLGWSGTVGRAQLVIVVSGARRCRAKFRGADVIVGNGAPQTGTWGMNESPLDSSSL